MCESLYQEDMEPDDLFEVISQALLNAQDRDALSGWGTAISTLRVHRFSHLFQPYAAPHAVQYALQSAHVLSGADWC